jgi:hypothetical protein
MFQHRLNDDPIYAMLAQRDLVGVSYELHHSTVIDVECDYVNFWITVQAI